MGIKKTVVEDIKIKENVVCVREKNYLTFT